MTEKNYDKCPRCGGDLQYEEVDIGVGIQRGNPGCPDCHWVPGAGPMIESYRETVLLPAGPAAPQTPQEDALGLSVDMLDVDRLRTWAENIYRHGPDVTFWAQPDFVVAWLRDFSQRLETAVRDVGTLRASSPSPSAAPCLKCGTTESADGDWYRLCGKCRWESPASPTAALREQAEKVVAALAVYDAECLRVFGGYVKPSGRAGAEELALLRSIEELRAILNSGSTESP